MKRLLNIKGFPTKQLSVKSKEMMQRLINDYQETLWFKREINAHDVPALIWNLFRSERYKPDYHTFQEVFLALKYMDQYSEVPNKPII